MKERKLLWVLLVMLTALFLAACTANEDAGEAPENTDTTEEGNGEDGEAAEETPDLDGKTLYINNGQEPTSFDPSVGFDQLSWDPLNNLMEGLTR